jgi:hypothetical protein
VEARPNGAPAPDSPPVPVPSSLTAAWRTYLDGATKGRATVTDLVLPSGMTVRAKRPSLLELMGAGRIPDTLAAKVESLIAQAQAEGGIQAILDAQRQADPGGFYQTYLTLLDVVWCEAVVEPRFSRGEPDPDPDVLPVTAVGIPDKQYLFTWAQGVDDAVATFPDRAARAAAVVGTGPDRDPLRPGPGGAAGVGSEG